MCMQLGKVNRRIIKAANQNRKGKNTTLCGIVDAYCVLTTTLRNNRQFDEILQNQIQFEIFFRLPTKAHILQVRIICWKHDIGLTSSKDMKGPKKQGERNWVKTHFFLCLHEAFFFTANFLPSCHLFGFLVFFQIKPLT